MTEISKDTEEKILIAAEDIFTKNGLDGARMQEIADKAGINKSLLHYYYRSKEKLFSSVFKVAFKKLIPQVITIISSDLPLFEKIKKFTSSYVDLVSKNQYIPMFVLYELQKNPEGILNIMLKTLSELEQNPVKVFSEDVKREIEKGNIREIDPRQLFVNMISMCVFPFIAKPLICAIACNNNENEFKLFLESRKTEISNFIINSIKI